MNVYVLVETTQEWGWDGDREFTYEAKVIRGLYFSRDAAERASAGIRKWDYEILEEKVQE